MFVFKPGKQQPPSTAGVWLWLFVKHSQTDHCEATCLLLNCSRSVFKQPVLGEKRGGLRSCLASIFSLLLSPFWAVVSTELEITSVASEALNVKFCLINKAVSLDRFFGLISFNGCSEGNEGVCQGRAEEGSRVMSANCSAVNYLHTTRTEWIAFFTFCYLLFWPLDFYVEESFW